MDLQNELSWSFSRQRTLYECQRRYYYRYYLSFGGWVDTSDKRRQKAYLLKHVVTLESYKGIVAHGEIARALTRLRRLTATESQRRRGEYRTPPKIDRDAVARQMTEAFTHSKMAHWTTVSPKRHPVFFEDLYEEGIAEDDSEAAIDEVVKTVQSFVEGQIYTKLTEAAGKGSVEWLLIDGEREDVGPEHFTLEGMKVYVSPDLCIRIGDKTHLFDWKSRPYPPEEFHQGAGYCLWLREKHRVSASDIVCRLATTSGHTIRVYTFDEDDLDRIARGVDTGVFQMEQLHQAGLDGCETEFLKTGEPDKCITCSFRALCADQEIHLTYGQSCKEVPK